MEKTTEMLKGLLEGSVLQIISRDTTYGYDITQRLNKLGFKDIAEGTVYTILVRLEKNGLLVSEKQPSEVGPPRKFYKLTEAGKIELHSFWSRWDFVSSKINEVRSQ